MDYVLVTTGGTIDKTCRDDDNRMCVGEPFAARFLTSLPDAARPAAVLESLRVDSLDMTEEMRAKLTEDILSSGGKRFLITHGTDTMEETASYLASRLPQDVSVVLTGAMTPAFIDIEYACSNVSFALGVLSFVPPGVRLAFAGEVFSAGEFSKDRKNRRFVRKGDV